MIAHIVLMICARALLTYSDKALSAPPIKGSGYNTQAHPKQALHDTSIMDMGSEEVRELCGLYMPWSSMYHVDHVNMWCVSYFHFCRQHVREIQSGTSLL